LDTPAPNLYEVYTIAHQTVGLRWLRDVCAPARDRGDRIWTGPSCRSRSRASSFCRTPAVQSCARRA